MKAIESRRFRTRVLFVLLFIVPAGAPGALAEDWGRQVKGFEAALASHDVEKWYWSLRRLEGQDHPAAAGYVLRFFVEHTRYEGEWKRGGRPGYSSFLQTDPGELYGDLLRGMRSVRSVRYLVDRIKDRNLEVADLCARSLVGRSQLHAADEEMRTGFRKALGDDDPSLARRLLTLLRGRLHVGDAAWIRREALRQGTPAEVRRDLLRAFVDMDLRRELLQSPGWEPALMKESGFENLDRILAEAEQVGAVLDEYRFASTEVWEREFASLGLRHAKKALGVVYVRLVRALLREKPLKSLERLHDASVKLRLVRTLRRDVYFHPERQRQAWDHRGESSRLAALATTVDFGAPEWREGVELSIRLHAFLTRLGGGSRSEVPGTPWHPDLFNLNQARKVGIETIAFCPLERERRDLRDGILEANRKNPIPSAAERGNVAILNAYRRTFALLPLRIDGDLTSSARSHCRFQKAVGAIAHVFPRVREPFGRTPRDRMINAGYPREHAGGENIYFGKREARAAFDWWRRSPGHRRNMLSPAWTEIGVGEVEAYWVQNFGTRPY